MSVPLQKQQALSRAYDDHADGLFRYCLVKLPHREQALDVVQEVFVRVWQYMLDDKEISNMKSFLFTTAHHLIIDDYRKKKLQSLDAMAEDGFDVVDTQGAPLLSVDSERALKAVQNLEPLYRDIIMMRYVNGLSPQEIAEITKLSENVVSVRIHRGLEKLRTILHINE